VPYDRVQEARQLIDSAPGDRYGTPGWSPGDDDDFSRFEQSEDGGRVTEDGVPNGTPAEAWTILPTEADLTHLQQVRRTHGDSLREWYWEDGKSGGSHYPNGGPTPSYEDDHIPELVRPRERSRYADPEYSEGWAPSPPWVKIVYGVLIAVVSLPFIASIFGQLAAFFGAR
jgi:hypothetical protein